MRTGAVTGVAVRHLADPDAEVACLLGAGVLAHTQLDALRTVLPRLREVRVYDPAAERCSRFCARAPRGDRPRRAPGRTRPRRPCAARRWSCRRRWPSSRPSPRRGSTRARPWCSSRAWMRRSTCTAVTDLLVVDDWEHESTHAGRYAERLVAAGLVAADGAGACELADVVTGRHPGRTDAGAAHRGDAGRPGDGRRRRRVARAARRAQPRPGNGPCAAVRAAGVGVRRVGASVVPFAPVSPLP